MTEPLKPRICGVVINSGLSTSRPDEPASLEWCGM